jgi:hypothetical protein
VLLVDVLELLFVPLQLPTLYPLEGYAVKLINSPAWYCPDNVHPDDFDGLAEGSLPDPL